MGNCWKTSALFEAYPVRSPAQKGLEEARACRWGRYAVSAPMIGMTLSIARFWAASFASSFGSVLSPGLSMISGSSASASRARFQRAMAGWFPYA